MSQFKPRGAQRVRVRLFSMSGGNAQPRLSQTAKQLRIPIQPARPISSGRNDGLSNQPAGHIIPDERLHDKRSELRRGSTQRKSSVAHGWVW